MAAPITGFEKEEPKIKKVRGKFRVVSLTEHHWSKSQRIVKLSVEYDTSIPEDQRFFDATPTGQIEMTVNNPAALEFLKLGKTFYVDFVPVE